MFHYSKYKGLKAKLSNLLSVKKTNQKSRLRKMAISTAEQKRIRVKSFDRSPSLASVRIEFLLHFKVTG